MHALINRLSCTLFNQSTKEYETYEDDTPIYEDKENPITIQLIIKTSLDQDIISSLTEDEKLELLLEVKCLHLERLNIRIIENLDIFDRTQILFLQDNNIEVIENLENMISLEYLSLKRNSIKKVQGLRTLKKLQLIDLSYNQLEYVDEKELPAALEFVLFQGNPIEHVLFKNLNKKCPQTKRRIIKHLLYIDEYCGQTVTQEERFKALGIFPQELSDYQNKLSEFKVRKKLSSQSSTRSKGSDISLNFKRSNNKVEKLEASFVKIEREAEQPQKGTETEDSVNQVREKTLSLLEHAQRTNLLVQNQNINELKEYSQLHQQIRNSIRESSMFNKKLESSQLM